MHLGFREARLHALVLVLAGTMLSTTVACTTYRDELARSQRSFEQNEHERTLALLRALEPDVGRLSTVEQAQYAYLRGMTDYRIGYRPDARHWLAIAKTYDDASPGMLPADWKARMIEALDEMNGVVYGEGLAALATPRKTGDDGNGATGVTPKSKSPGSETK